MPRILEVLCAIIIAYTCNIIRKTVKWTKIQQNTLSQNSLTQYPPGVSEGYYLSDVTVGD